MAGIFESGNAFDNAKQRWEEQDKASIQLISLRNLSETEYSTYLTKLRGL
jgi:hypothetical protein